MLTVNTKTLSKHTDPFLFLPTSLSPQKISNQLCNQFFNTTICALHPRSLKLLLGASLSLPHSTFLGVKNKTAIRLCGLTFFYMEEKSYFQDKGLRGL